MTPIETEDMRKYEKDDRWINRMFFNGLTIKSYLISLINPFNIVTGTIIFAGVILVILRFVFGLNQVTDSSDTQPWGLLLGVGLFTGVPFSASGFVMGTAVYIFGLKKYQPVVTNAILLGFLGYLFAVIFLMTDLGRPWRIYYPMFISFGAASVMFLVAWHVALYLSVQALEFSSSAFEWLGIKSLRKLVIGMTMGLTIAGIMLSTLHQSALGAMFLLAPGKIHPLWWSSYMPWLFFVSALAGGLVYVIIITKLTQMLMSNRADERYLSSINEITLGIGKACGLIVFTYVGLRLASITYENTWSYLEGVYGQLFMVEFLLFALAPFIFIYGSQKKNVGAVQIAALITMIAIILNRLNTAYITFNWQLPDRELFYWKEVIVVFAFLMMEIVLYRWIVNRMPVLRQHPDFIGEEH